MTAQGQGWAGDGRTWVLRAEPAAGHHQTSTLLISQCPPAPPLAGATLGKRSQRAKAPDSHSFISFIHFREKVLFPIKAGGIKSDSKLFVGGCVQSETAQLGDTAVSSWETVGLDRLPATERDRTF